MLKIGHRGIPKQLLENSLSGFEYCSEFGANGIEYDVRTDKNGVFWIMHDDSTKRTCTEDVLMAETSTSVLEQIRMLDGSTIPQLRTVLQRFPKLLHNIELKTNDAAELISFLDEITPKITLPKEQIVLTSFLPENWPIFAQSDYRFGCLFENITENEIAQIGTLQPEFVVLNHAFAEESIVKKCIADKLKVWLYTVNEQEAIRFWKSTVLIDGIISDDFTLLNEM